MKTLTLATLALLFGLTEARQNHHLVQLQRESDELCDGDSADDRELDDENDPNDPVVHDHGFRAGIYNYNLNNYYVQLPERPMDNQALLYAFSRYSDTIANGDSADDKDLHEEEDVNDDVVDINGSGKSRFGIKTNEEYFAGNHIFEDHFGTIPREESPNQNWI